PTTMTLSQLTAPLTFALNVIIVLLGGASMVTVRGRLSWFITLTASFENIPRTTTMCGPGLRPAVGATKRKEPIGLGLPLWSNAIVFGMVCLLATMSVCTAPSIRIWNCGHPVGVPPPEQVATRGGSL